MDELQIDKLLLEIEVKQSDTAKTVNSIARSVDKLTKSLTNFDTDYFSEKLEGLGKAIGKLKIEGLGSLSSDFSKISNALKNITKVDFDAQKLYKKFSSLTRIVKPFVEELQKSEQALIAMDGILKSRASAFNVRQSGAYSSTTSAKTKGNIFDVGNMYHIVRLVQFVGRGLQKVGGFMKDIVQAGVDYTETLNLWQVAMGKNAEQAEDFIYRMSKAYGYATTTLMQYQATFRNMLSNLGGVDSNVSYKLSEYLMQMAGDYASLYNVSIEKAMQSFQSVLAGQVRPIRSVSGYDITENTIFELYQSLGGEKTMRQLSQTEKRLLRIMAIFQQMERSGAVGDLSKTLGNSANQLRIINEQVTELKTWLGNILEMYLRPILPIVQAFLMVATEVAKVIAKNLGYEAFDGAISGLEETNEQADELAGKLLSFDKFESLNSSSGDNALGIDSKLLDGMARYEALLDHSKTIAQEMADDILPLFIDENGELTAGAQKIQDTIEKIFGFAKNLYTIGEDGTIKWTEETESLIAKLKSTAFLLGSIATLFTGKKLLSGIQNLISAYPLFNSKIIDNVKELGSAGLDSNSIKALAMLKGDKLNSTINSLGLGGKLAIITAIVGALVYLYNTNEDVRESIDGLFEALKPLGDILIDLAKTILPIIGKILQGLAPLLNVIIRLVQAVVLVVESVLVVVIAPLEFILKLIQSIIELLNFTDWSNLGEKFDAIWGNWEMTGGFTSHLSNYYSSTPREFANYGSTPNGITSANTVMTQSVYNSTMAANAQSGAFNSGVGDVYLDGKKVGTHTAKSTHQENVRVGSVKANK